MRAFCVGGGRPSGLGAFVGVVAVIGLFAPGARAVLAHVGRGQVAGVTPRVNVNPASIRGSFAKHRGATGFSSSGNLDYHGGSVLHASAPYLIFWDPQNKISASSKALYERYFADSAAANGTATNVFAVNRQYTDSSRFADYAQSFSPRQSITDRQPYPTTGNCTESSFPEKTCLYDAQLRAEINRLIGAAGLPTGITGNAPIYFVVTPPDVNSCFSDNTTCADNFFCAYHSSDVHRGSTVLYADIPTVLAANDPKGCQSDNNLAVQSPNGDPITDIAIKSVSHEFNETITDPVNAGGWYDTVTGNEDGDNCNVYGPTVDPAGGSNPNAFTPYLGGSPSAGTLFDQLINGNPYYTQSEWSNGAVNCNMQPTASTLSAVFTAPSSAAPGTAVSFDPSTSTSSGGYTSTTWSFGDGSPQMFAMGAPTPVSHSYSAFTTHTVTLTLVDTYGNLSTAARTVAGRGALMAAFTASSAHVAAGSPVLFLGSSSSEPGGSISSYSWSFGDGTSGTGVSTSHPYGTAGTYMITLTVMDASGGSASSSARIIVSSVASAVISHTSGRAIAGVRFAFDGSQSQDTGSSLTGYGWSFGDRLHASGVSPTHTFARTGDYIVTLTVTDPTGATSTALLSISVKAPSITKVKVKKGRTVQRLKVTVNGPGVLRVGSRRFRASKPRTITVKVTLSNSQLHTLLTNHELTLQVKLKFVPRSGRTSRRTVKVSLRS